MIDVLVRVAVVVVAIATAGWLIGRWERRKGRPAARLAPGLTLVTGEGCGLCLPAETALRRSGGDPAVRDVTELDGTGVATSSLPVAVVVAPDGTVAMRRAGRAVIRDAPDLVARSRQVSKS